VAWVASRSSGGGAGTECYGLVNGENFDKSDFDPSDASLLPETPHRIVVTLVDARTRTVHAERQAVFETKRGDHAVEAPPEAARAFDACLGRRVSAPTVFSLAPGPWGFGNLMGRWVLAAAVARLAGGIVLTPKMPRLDVGESHADVHGAYDHSVLHRLVSWPCELRFLEEADWDRQAFQAELLPFSGPLQSGEVWEMATAGFKLKGDFVNDSFPETAWDFLIKVCRVHGNLADVSGAGEASAACAAVFGARRELEEFLGSRSNSCI